MKKVLCLLLSVFMVLALAGCSGSSNEGTDTASSDASSDGYKIAVVTDVGQLNDGGFNQGTYEGAKEFAEANGISYKYYQPANGADATDDDRIAAMRQAIEGGAEVIVTPGFLQETAIKTVAAESPEVKFLFVDGYTLGLANVTAISYQEEQSGFFAGYAAVKDGYTKLGGTFGGAGANPACNRFAYGYAQGANAAAGELGTTVDVKISFQNGAAFSASPELLTQISGWYANGTEVVFSCGGSMVSSVIAAAQENGNAKVIGVDVDQAGLYDGVITSAVKGLSASVVKVLGEWNNGEWDSKLADKESKLGAADNATGIPTASSSWRFAKFTTAEYEELFAKVVAGEVTIKSDVGADMSTADAWASLKADCKNINLVIE